MTATERETVLDYIDQASFLGWSALGRTPLIQLMWSFEDSIDGDILERFRVQLGYTLLGRLIRRSLVPFGRHCWVRGSDPGRSHFHPDILPPEQLVPWADLVRVGVIDPERGPGWQLDGVALQGGGSALVLTAPHCLVDGIAILEAVADAIEGVDRIQHLPLAPARLHAQTFHQDLGVAIRSLAAIGVAVGALIRSLCAMGSLSLPRRTRRHQRITRGGHGFEHPEVPFVCVGIRQSDWERRYLQLDGSSTALQAAMVAQLAVVTGRVDGAGAVSLVMPVSTRAKPDSRANALQWIRFPHTPQRSIGSLQPLSRRILRQLGALKRERRWREALLGLSPYVPRAAIRWIESKIHGESSTVTVSNIGKLSACVVRPMCMSSQHILIRFIEKLSTADLEHMGGTMYSNAWSIGGTQYLSFRVWQPGTIESRAQLTSVVEEVLRDFELKPHVLI